MIERLVVLTKSEQINTEHLPPEITGLASNPKEGNLSLEEAVQKFEADFIKKALEKAGGKKNKAAKMLGIHRNTLLQIEKKLDL